MGKGKKPRTYDAPTDKQLHAGVRFPEDMAAKMRFVIDEANGALAVMRLPPTVTVSGCVKAWVGERLEEEYQIALRRKAGVMVEGGGLAATTDRGWSPLRVVHHDPTVNEDPRKDVKLKVLPDKGKGGGKKGKGR